MCRAARTFALIRIIIKIKINKIRKEKWRPHFEVLLKAGASRAGRATSDDQFTKGNGEKRNTIIIINELAYAYAYARCLFLLFVSLQKKRRKRK